MLILFICAIVGLLLTFIGSKINPDLRSNNTLKGTLKNIITTIVVAIGSIISTCSIIAIILTPFLNIIIDEQELEDLTETTIEENYKDCAFIEYNQFYYEGKLYQYRWDKSKSKVIITCKDDSAKEVDCFKLDN
jgi:hypothetical protein